MKLVIVESPTKAKTIQRFLGKDYKIISSLGHVRDLPKSELGIDEKNNFEPRYVIPLKARKTVSLLKKEAQKAETLILATDEDREGEAIAWHILNVITSKKGKKEAKEKEVKRIVFHEITKEAIIKALQSPRNINMKLVEAQQARRILDRLVGYKLSPFLWKKIARGLSAGRVQSVAVRLICEREEEISRFKPREYWTISAILAKETPAKGKVKKKAETLEAALIKKGSQKLGKFAIANEDQAKEIKQDLEKAQYKVLSLTQKETTKSPLPPYTTSTLQQDAAIRLGFSAKKTMFLAQGLYEGIKLGKKGNIGLITYMRTDSVNLAESFLQGVQKYLKDTFSPQYFAGLRYFKTKSKSAQEAHEAIRPTDITRIPDSIKDYLSRDQLRLYQLIWQRALASQMAPAIFEETKIAIEAKGKETYLFEAKGKIEKFDGFTKIYPLKNKDTFLPSVEKGQPLSLREILANQKFTQPPKRYSEAMLIKTLEKYGIGRPSTYAPIISTIQLRGYVKKNEDKRFIPTEVGVMVNKLLEKHFSEIVDYDFTAKMEQDLDQVALGKKEWSKLLKEFYEPFARQLEKNYTLVADKKDQQVKTDKKCPLCGGALVEKFSRYGKFLACSNYPKCKYIESSNDKANQSPQYSDKKCPKCGGKLVYKKSRFGEFLGCENYPKCKYTEALSQKTGVDCPKCSKGEIVQKRTKKGRIFYGCNNYPNCKFALWQKPTGEKCPRCSALLVEDKKGKIFCSNKLCDYKKK